MHVLGTVVYALILLGVGAVGGAAAAAVWWGVFIRNPEHARAFLRGVYRRSHPHWLKRKSDPPDGPRICPCCGWSETAGIGVPTSTGTVNDPHCRTDTTTT